MITTWILKVGKRKADWVGTTGPKDQTVSQFLPIPHTSRRPRIGITGIPNQQTKAARQTSSFPN